MRRNKLINLRKRKGLTQADIADRIGVTRGFYGHIETGLCDPSLKVGLRIIKFLDADYNIFFDIDDSELIKKTS